ncbi:MAG: hypothetical protein EOP11_22285 [Proteobacteria bacterium]|nr:MAG: hypothetical protein EOP11_22285 [Pseudomonadota bacterium]
MLSGGEAAVRLKLSEKYLKKIRNLADAHTEVIMPGKLQNFDDWMKNIGFAGK